MGLFPLQVLRVNRTIIEGKKKLENLDVGMKTSRAVEFLWEVSHKDSMVYSKSNIFPDNEPKWYKFTKVTRKKVRSLKNQLISIVKNI